MRQILVTGGAGFIGSHLCEYLLGRNNYVICVDNLFTGCRNNIEHLLNNPNFEFKIHDIIDPLYINKVDQLYNLACPASPVHYQFNAIRTIKANTIGVINMLGLAKHHKARFLQASTSEVYGDPLEHPQKETYHGNVNCTGLRSCYDEGKRVAETLCYDYHRQNKVDIRIARIFNTYGPGMALNDGRVVSNFIVQALRGENITIYGNGNQTRSFCYVDDMVEGLYKMMEQTQTYGPVNLGNPEEYTIMQLAEIINEETNSTSRIIQKPLPEDDPIKRRPDISLAKHHLAWEPKTPLRAGLRKTIPYFERIVKNPIHKRVVF